MSDASTSPLSSLSSSVAEIVARAAHAVASVRSHRSLSSGFAWKRDLIVTADEALADEGDVVVIVGEGANHSATIVGRDPTTDIALLRVENAGLEPVTLTSDAVRAGSLVVTVGAREGAPIAAVGAVAVSGPQWRSMRGGDIDARIELDLRLRREAEGGLVLGASSHALGMAVLGPRQRPLVIPAVTVERVAGALERHGRIPRGYLGLGLQPVRTDVGSGKGVMVMSVDADGPGAAAGLYQGDIIVTWDAAPMSSANALLRALGPTSVGRTVTLGLRRSGKPLDVRLTIGERPPA
jgi:S1-C subfamily serine protease